MRKISLTRQKPLYRSPLLEDNANNKQSSTVTTSERFSSNNFPRCTKSFRLHVPVMIGPIFVCLRYVTTIVRHYILQAYD